MATLTFHGAAGTVTGSCHLFEAGGAAYLLDCGQFQGGPDLEQRNFAPFGFDPREVRGVLLSHGHFDHCGRIPLLVKQGFQGHVICTPPTRDIARLILLDSAYVQREDFRTEHRRLARAGRRARAPLYGVEDVLEAMDRFDRVVEYHAPVELEGGARVVFTAEDAGHILGSAQVLLEYPGADGRSRRLLYTGDLGENERPLQHAPAPPPAPVDVLVMETTYGDRRHRPLEESVAEFRAAVLETVAAGGTVLVPTFALERSQEILYHLGRMKREGVLAPEVPVFLNSPLAIDLTRLYHRHCRFCRPEVAEGLSVGRSPFAFPGVHFTEAPEESRAIHNVPGPKIVLAGSGMMAGGRIRHHLKHLLWKPSTTLIVVGYQAEGTLGREIVEGARRVEVFGEEVAVEARVLTINGFSAHAGQDALLAFARAARPRHVVLVHGEPSAAETFSRLLRGALPEARVTVAREGETLEV
ncbi:MBL fold metallo-hydrolase [Dissulfurirhabdus thermomarina]|uniref:MBL fold metallo-hydrolase n=1 Tax=Dissulfurirhabdus thermomarina TaxID=1765737 RepID=A0A6N9TP42_DISTH|nr:MBL fold metallo-hydrolase [Dissulfurirhabdus thermomarina]NDY41514.1 MBL fold metallo-hydrolase [Dissulfurirhabdus thermomarina]NMX22967.1 MBL fold metallo-hydrolase [Dissulfurirhabdus thermomarina]